MQTRGVDRQDHSEAYDVRYRHPGARDYVVVSRIVLLGYARLSDGAKLTYWVVASHDWYAPSQGGRKGYAYPTLGRLAQLRHTTPRTIRRHLAELIGAGLLTREERPGRPSILYIEEPSARETASYLTQQGMGADKNVRGGRTKMSSQEEDKEKQTNPVNGDEKDSLEEESRHSIGLTPIKQLLQTRSKPRASRDRGDWLAEEIIGITGDPHSRGCYQVIARRCPESLVFEALALLKEARRDGVIRQSRGALFVGIIRRLCKERGLADPLAHHKSVAGEAGKARQQTRERRLTDNGRQAIEGRER